MHKTAREKALALFARSGVLRPRDVVAAGVPAWAVYELLKDGTAERVGRGLYALAKGKMTENRSYLEAIKLIPKGIICLLSALRLHKLTMQNPHEIWVAIDRRAWKPRIKKPRVRILRFSGEALTTGVERKVIEGAPVAVTNVPRTIADCFKYRNKIGLDAALEALHDGWKQKRFTVDEIWRYAKLCRVTKVMMPYLETLP